jgi:hypothetical protein
MLSISIGNTLIEIFDVQPSLSTHAPHSPPPFPGPLETQRTGRCTEVVVIRGSTVLLVIMSFEQDFNRPL